MRERPQNGGVWTGTLELDLLLGDVHSLKEKRSLVRPLVAELRRRFEVSAAEVGHLDLHRRAAVGVALVSADRAHVVEVLDAAERLTAYRPELELLSARRRLTSTEDE
jgi:uncharacterized protein YlxP (DUF503 family)